MLHENIMYRAELILIDENIVESILEIILIDAHTSVVNIRRKCNATGKIICNMGNKNQSLKFQRSCS